MSEDRALGGPHEAGGSPNPTPPTVETGKEESFIQIAFPQQATIVFAAALVLGFLLIGLPTIFRTYFAVNGTQANLVLCIGAGLVLAAFGGQARVQIGRIMMAGAAGIALGLFAYLQYNVQQQFLMGTISDYDSQKYESLHISSAKPLLGVVIINNDNLVRSKYDFFIRRSDIEQKTIDISLVTRDKDPETKAKKEIALFVHVKDVEWAFGEQRRVEWQIKSKTVGGDKVVALYDKIFERFISDETMASLPPQRKPTYFAWSLIPVGAALAKENEVDVSVLLERLSADDTDLRRSARDGLSTVPITALPPIMAFFKKNFSEYRIKLGICVALAQMLRTDKSKGKAISDRLTPEDLGLLLDAAGDPDRTVRSYATEFLFDLGDPRSVRLALNRAAIATDDKARYNWLFSTQDAWRKLSPGERTELRQILENIKQQSGPQTRDLIDKLNI
jgi:hypothetical protein